MRGVFFNVSGLGLLAMATGLAGCGIQTRSPIVPVTGKIAFADGRKLPEGTLVVFSPVLGGAGAASASTDAEGNFSVVHASGKQGAEVGDYMVELRSPLGMEQEFYRSVPSGYTDGGALATSVPSQGGEIKLMLHAPRRKR